MLMMENPHLISFSSFQILFLGKVPQNLFLYQGKRSCSTLLKHKQDFILDHQIDINRIHHRKRIRLNSQYSMGEWELLVEEHGGSWRRRKSWDQHTFWLNGPNRILMKAGLGEQTLPVGGLLEDKEYSQISKVIRILLDRLSRILVRIGCSEEASRTGLEASTVRKNPHLCPAHPPTPRERTLFLSQRA